MVRWIEGSGSLNQPVSESESMRISPLLAAVAIGVTVHGGALPASGQTSVASAEQASGPDWIWLGTRRSSNQVADFRKSFELRERVSEAHLQLAADFTDCEITLNGTRITRLDDYGPQLNLEVTDQLLRGRNVIQLRCRSSEGPSAVAASLTAVGSELTKTVLRTNSSWEYRLSETASDASNDLAAGTWTSAASLGVVASRFWDGTGTKARITKFDDYTQWKQASNGDEEEDVERFMTLPGFSIDRIRRA